VTTVEQPRTAFVTRLLPWLLTAGGAVGLTAAFVLTVEKISLLRNPDYIPSCSIDPILSCGSIMRTEQAEAFGFPNPLLGIVGFSIVVTVGVLLFAGVGLPRWFWLGLQAGVTAGVVFVHWLIYQSLYEIGALCPYCMVVWAVTIPIFWYVTVHNFGHTTKAGGVLADYHGVVLTLWYVLIIAGVLEAFWSYWVTVF
jgi:uncharacterized membrane protein